MPSVHIDDTVLAYLREHRQAGDTYNHTVRTLLGLPPAPSETTSPEPATPGALLPLITAGALTPGETLTWVRIRRGEIHTASVDEVGRMVTADGACFSTPDTCASAIAGYPCKGWPNWRTTTGDTLQQLRDQTA